MKILVVDDSQTMRKIMRNALEGMGYSAASIVEASDGAEAMRKLRDRRFKVDIILADWNMPNMDGLSFLRQLQGMEEAKNVPFIMVTGQAERGRVLEAIRAGARNYVLKPFTPETLRQKVLAVEMELLARKKPTDTAVFRFKAAEVSEGQPVAPNGELPFLAQLPEGLLAAIYKSASRSEHEKGAVLIEPADIVQSLHIIERGEVEIIPRDGPHKKRPRGEVRGRGECFGELSFLSGDPAGSGARARTEVAVASVGKDDFERLLAEHPDLSFYLTRLLAKRARKADAKLASELEKGLSGRLSTMAIPEIAQTLHNSRKTGLLRVESGGEEGEVYFVEGGVRHARVGGQRGEEAFYQLVTWAEGSFTFEIGSRPVEHDIFRATMGLLIEGMCREDELRRMRA